MEAIFIFRPNNTKSYQKCFFCKKGFSTVLVQFHTEQNQIKYSSHTPEI